MTAALRLFRIETRRSLGLWLLAPMLILAAYLPGSAPARTSRRT
jgi:hypothetical protein